MATPINKSDVDSVDRIRFHVAVVGGSGPIVADGLYGLLRRRLLVYTTMLAGAFLISLVLDVVSQHFGIIGERNTEIVGVSGWLKWLSEGWRANLVLVITSGASLALWLWPPRSVSGLRGIELAILGILVAVTLDMSVHDRPYGFLEQAASLPEDMRQALVQRYALAGSILWFAHLVAYGALIPNTWQRSAIVCSIVGLSPLILFALFGLWIRPLPSDIVVDVLLTVGFYVSLAVCIVVFSTSRIEFFRQQAEEARKLGQYVLREQLGVGGMGEVYRAEHLLLRRPCALKMIRPQRAGDPNALRRFEREVQITATLTHPNTVQVFDYGHTEDGTFYYTMEYLPGLTLEEIVRRHGPLPPGRAVHFLVQVCAALSEAHSRGLTHRDIKPSNVMICERGGVRDVVKLLDFGLVRIPKEHLDSESLTREGSIEGTPAYMSPEQASGNEVIDATSDVNSVGALAYFLLTGAPPFAERSAVRMLAAHMYETPAALPGSIPPDLAAIIMKCLAKARGDRFPEATSLVSALSTVSVTTWTRHDANDWWKRADQTVFKNDQALASTTLVEPAATPESQVNSAVPDV